MQIGTYMGFAVTVCVLTVFMFITYCIALVDYSHISSCKKYHYSYFKVYCYSASKRHMAAVGTGLGSCLLICTVVQFMLSLTASIYCCGAVCCNTPTGMVRIISRHFVFMNLHGRIFGNCEEELPKKPVGRQTADSRPTVGRLLVMCR